MKAERRHELEHNELDHLLAKAAQFLRENGVLLGIIVAVVVLAAITYYGFLAERSITAPAGKWNDYFSALSDPQDPKSELRAFVEDEKGSVEPPVLWARLTLADQQLAEAAEQLFSDRKAAEESLVDAEKNYAAVEKSAGRVPELRDRARLGLAEVYECQNKPEEALKYYEMVLKSSEESPYGKAAARGMKRLSEEKNREFLSWFAQQEPVQRPGGMGRPPFDPRGPLSETPDFSLPELDDKAITPGLDFPKLPGDIKEVPGTAPLEKTPPPRPEPPSTDSEKKTPKDAESKENPPSEPNDGDKKPE